MVRHISDVAESRGDDRAALLTVIPARDGRFPAVLGYLLQPAPGGPADPAGWAPEPPAGLVVDRDQRKVLLDGQEIELVFQEFELLDFLAAHPYRTFTREQIIAGAWAGRPQATGRTVDVHVHRLRRKLGPGYARYLVTVQRVGYTFHPPRLATAP